MYFLVSLYSTEALSNKIWQYFGDLVGYNSWSHRVRHDWVHTHTCTQDAWTSDWLCKSEAVRGGHHSGSQQGLDGSLKGAEMLGKRYGMGNMVAQFSRLTLTGVQLKKHGFLWWTLPNKHKSRENIVSSTYYPSSGLLHGYSCLGYPLIRADLTENDLQWWALNEPLPLRKKEEHGDERARKLGRSEQSADLLLEIGFLPSEIGDGWR